LVVLFGAELLVISAELDTRDLLHRSSAIVSWIETWGPATLRYLISFSVLFACLALFGTRPLLLELSRRIAATPLRWAWLAAHAVSMVLFGVLSVVLFYHPPARSAQDLLAISWILAGVAGIVCGAFTFVAWRFWVDLVVGTGWLWLQSAVVAGVAGVLTNPSRALWQPATRATLAIVGWLLRPMLPDLAFSVVTKEIGTPRFSVEIAPQCSGLEGAGLMLAFGVLWLWLFRKEFRFPQALALIPAGMIMIFLLNAVRIAALMLIGNAGAEQIALGGFHSQAGWIFFNAVAFGLSAGSLHLPWFSQPASAIRAGGASVSASAPSPMLSETSSSATAATDDAAVPAYVVPFLAILAAGMVATAVSAGFEWLYGLRVLAAIAVLVAFRPWYRQINWHFSWVAMLAGVAVLVLWIWPEIARFLGFGDPAQSAVSGMPMQLAAASPWARTLWIGIRIFGAVVTVPIAEELAFRGFLLRRLVGPQFLSVSALPLGEISGWVALLGSSIAFGVLHGGHLISGVAAGLAYALAYLHRGRLGEAVAAHSITNALLAAYVLYSGNWNYW
jgi:exosortase E/protease (VPEID-CTERM system)